MSEIRYCANGCTRKADNDTIPVAAEPPSRICGHCETNLTKWLRTIPDHYAILPTFLEHGTTETNPESKATKSAVAPAPMRLEIIDLLDTRLYRKWQGTETTDDRRGTIGILHAHALRVTDERNLTSRPSPTVTTLAAFLTRHLLWIAEQEWVDEFTSELKTLHKALSDAVGEYRRPPVGHCHIARPEADACGGPLFASPYGGVRCARCHTTWDAEHLRQLGLAQQETA